MGAIHPVGSRGWSRSQDGKDQAWEMAPTVAWRGGSGNLNPHSAGDVPVKNTREPHPWYVFSANLRLIDCQAGNVGCAHVPTADVRSPRHDELVGNGQAMPPSSFAMWRFVPDGIEEGDRVGVGSRRVIGGSLSAQNLWCRIRRRGQEVAGLESKLLPNFPIPVDS